MSENVLGSDPRTITLGEGKVVVSYGFLAGAPCLFFAAASKPGEIGKSAEGERNEQGGLESPVCIRFTSLDSVLHHLDLIREMVEHVEKRVCQEPRP